MKRLTSTAILALMTITVWAQGEIVNKYFEKFKGDETFVKVSVSSKMFSLFTELEAGSPEEEAFLKAVAKIKGLKMVVGDSVVQSKKLFDEATNEIAKAGFEELMTVLDAEENFRFSIKEKNGIISELIMVAGGKKRFVLISMYGEIDLKNISKIARAMSIDGLKELERIDGQGN